MGSQSEMIWHGADHQSFVVPGIKNMDRAAKPYRTGKRSHFDLFLDLISRSLLRDCAAAVSPTR